MSEVMIRATFKGQPDCLICGKAMHQHSFDEAKACVAAEKAKIADKPCPVCGCPFGQHSNVTYRACAQKQNDSRGASGRTRI